VFEEWKILVETQIGRKVKKLRTNNELEFCDERFKTLCKQNGITKHLIMRGTPQQNGLVERFNITILERVKCMLNNVGLPKSFWAEAVSTVVYCISRSPSIVIGFKTLHEAWSGMKADYSELKTFGYIGYAHLK